jgi:hypothetical protein
MVIGKPAPFVSAFVDAVDAAIRTHQPHHAMSVTQRTWLAFCITAVLVTNSMCWARFERASLGTYALAALSWMFRHRKIPWAQLLVASVRVILRHHGITSGSLVDDDTDNPRSKSAKALAYLYKLRDKPTVCPSVASRNLLLYQSLPISIPYRYALVRRRKDDTGVGTASRGIVE